MSELRVRRPLISGGSMLKQIATFFTALLVSSIALAQSPAAAPATPPAAAGVGGTKITDFIGERSVIVGEIDLKKIDPAAVETWVFDMMKQAGMVAPAAPNGIPENEFRGGFAEMKRWVA